jgi:hypothetical protein
MSNQDAPTVLYRFFDGEGKLLYVGISRNPAERFGVHKHSAPWWDEATSCTWERFATAPQAVSAERAAIIAESPVYNQQGKPRPARPAREVATPIRNWIPNRGSEIACLYRDGKTPAQITTAMGYGSTSTVYRWLHKLRDAGEIEPPGEERTA